MEQENKNLESLKTAIKELAMIHIVSQEEKDAMAKDFAENNPDTNSKKIARTIENGAKEGYREQVMKIMKHYRSALTDGVPLSDAKLQELITEMEKTNSFEDMLKDTVYKESLVCTAMEKALQELPKYQYRGFFIDERALTRALQEKGIELPEVDAGWKRTDNLHITTSIQKEVKANYSDIGSQAKIAVTGYAYDPQKGLALDIELVSSDSEKAKQEFEATKRIRPAHITIATAPNIKPKEMGTLFEETTPVRFEPIKIAASYGGFTQEGTVDILNQTEKSFQELAGKIVSEKETPFTQGLLHANTKDIGDRTIYLKSIIDQRTEGPNNAGSSFAPIANPNDIYDNYSEILSAIASTEYTETTEKEQARGAIAQNRRSFEVPIPGKQGIMDASQLPDDATIYAIDGHGVGNIEFCAEGVEKIPVETTTLIMANFGGYELVVTALPGDVRAPSNLQDKGFHEGDRFTKEEVLKLVGNDAVIKYVPQEKIKELQQLAKPKEKISDLNAHIQKFVEKANAKKDENTNEQQKNNETRSNR